MTSEEYREGVAKLAQLVKPGGTVLTVVDENVQAWVTAGKKFKTHPVNFERVSERDPRVGRIQPHHYGLSAT